MDALLALRVESLMVFSFVIAAYILRFILVQYAICITQKAIYEQHLLSAISKIEYKPIITKSRQDHNIISPAQYHSFIPALSSQV